MLLIFRIVMLFFSVNTKVEVRFNINEADWIPEFAKPILKEQVPVVNLGFIVRKHFRVLNCVDSNWPILLYPLRKHAYALYRDS